MIQLRKRSSRFNSQSFSKKKTFAKRSININYLLDGHRRKDTTKTSSTIISCKIKICEILQKLNGMKINDQITKIIKKFKLDFDRQNLDYSKNREKKRQEYAYQSMKTKGKGLKNLSSSSSLYDESNTLLNSPNNIENTPNKGQEKKWYKNFLE